MFIMKGGYAHPRLSVAMAAGLLVLLAVLASLQYRWIGEVSQAERERMRSSLQTAAERFREDFDREILRVFFHFSIARPGADLSPSQIRQTYAERFRLWATGTPHPSLVENVYLVDRTPEEKATIERLDRDTQSFLATEWPKDLGHLARFLEAPPGDQRRGGRIAGRLPLQFTEENVPVLLIPLRAEPPAAPPLPNDRMPPTRRPRNELRTIAVIELDLDGIRNDLVPGLVERHFIVGHALDYELGILAGGEPPEMIYSSDPALAASHFETRDASTPLFSLPRDGGTLRGVWLDTMVTLGGGSLERVRPAFERGFPGPMPWAQPDGEGHWQLAVRHRAGSLEAAVGATRRRNLAISLGILILLTASVAMILVATGRAQHLAGRQMAFVAGVSHELRTPLTVIRSAGQNLADGTVEERDQVRRYGQLVETEGRRLTAMVDQVLEFAGIQSGRKRYATETIDVQELVSHVLDDFRPVIVEQGVRVDLEIPDNVPHVVGDRQALRHAVANLLDNAIKYCGREGWVGVRVKSGKTSAGGRVTIRVEDKGPGIDKADLPHVFEPFYRGRAATSEKVPGSGLGLSLVRQIVEAHGGRVRVESRPNRGTSLTIDLPAEGERREGAPKG